MNAMNYDSDWDYYDSIGADLRDEEQQAEYDADNADMPTCDEDYE